MKSIYSFIVPEYYPNFKCKTSECRHPCCEGWKITISKNDYFRLVGAECSKKLRGKLDCALKVTGRTDDGCYAEISCDFSGRCKLHRSDGLCAIQTELGEEYLPSVCRYYPRAVQHAFTYKCTCSNSCEAVIETLSEIKTPLRYIEKQLPVIKEPDHKEINTEEFNVQRSCIDIVQDRRFSLPDRLSLLCDYIWDTSDKNTQNIQADIAEALSIMHRFTNWFVKSSLSVHGYCCEAQRYYGIEEKDELSAAELADVVIRYQVGKREFEKFYPEWQIFFEHIIVNHMFYEDFPYSKKHENIRGSFVSLAAVYSFLRFNAIGYCIKDPTREAFVDIAAALFRLIEHSGFDNNAVIILGKLNYIQPEKLTNLIFI